MPLPDLNTLLAMSPKDATATFNAAIQDEGKKIKEGADPKDAISEMERLLEQALAAVRNVQKGKP